MSNAWRLAVIGTLCCASAAQAVDPLPSQVTLPRCLLSLVDEVDVPAQEAGQLVAVETREGMEVEAGALLAQIDDQQPQHLKNIAVLEQQSAAEQASNDVNVRYSKAAALVAEAEYQQAIEANRKQPGTISQAEERRRLLALRRSSLQIEQSQFEQRIAALTSQTKGAEVAASDTAIERRQIIAPLGGVVVDLLKKRGEWVQPGDAVLRIVRIDRIRVEGFLNASQYGPDEVSNRPVVVSVPLARGRVEQFRGKVVFVNPLVEADGEFRIWAEVVNRSENSQWLLRPGLYADMTIQLSAAPQTSPPLGEQPSSAPRLR